MALDISALKQKLNQFTRQGNRSDALWKPKEGKQIIRIVPWKENPENPFIEMHFHYLGNKTHLSPTTNGNRDPILEFADALAAEGTKDAWRQARPFRPKLRTFVPVVVRGDEAKGVRFMSFGKTVYTELLSIISDPDYGDITNPEAGHDLVIEYIPQEKSDTNFAKTMVRPKPKKTPLVDDASRVEELLEDQPDIKSIFKEPTYEELKAYLEYYLDPEGAPSTSRYSGNNNSSSTENTTTSSESSDDDGDEDDISDDSDTSSSVSDMIDEFDEVFG